jgi:hypothetical protein
MSEAPREFEIVWLKEAEKRVGDGLPLNYREMLVALRDKLPRGFKPSDVSGRLLYADGPSVSGLQAIGDESALLPDIERAIRYVRGRLIEYPSLEKITAANLSDALNVDPKRAERVLQLVSSLGSFSSGGARSTHGFTEIHIGTDEVVTEYLGFKDLPDLLAERANAVPRQIPSPRAAPLSLDLRPPSRDTAFILMNMDPQDDSLVDVRDAIKSECAAYELEAVRIDEIEHQDRITDRILDMIHSSGLIIADLTGERPNVYYEIGYAHAIGKRPILYRRKGTRLHFDLSVHNVPEYKNIAELKSLLHKRLEAILGRAARTELPI